MEGGNTLSTILTAHVAAAAALRDGNGPAAANGAVFCGLSTSACGSFCGLMVELPKLAAVAAAKGRTGLMAKSVGGSTAGGRSGSFTRAHVFAHAYAHTLLGITGD